MTIEKFLLFWSQHNSSIIEGLIGLIVLMSLFLAYRSFFGKKSEGHDIGVSANGSIDAGQLEKTLQKILENQNHGAKHAPADDFSVNTDIDHASETPGAGAAGAESAGGEGAAAEVAQLRAALSENTKKMELLKAQLSQAQEQVSTANAAAAAAGSAAPAASAADSGASAQEREEMNNKLRDLEARLAEYEIISEDIADLSRYREENDDLKKQIEALKSAGPTAAAPKPAPVAAAPVPPPEPEPVPAAPAVEPVTPKLAAVPNEPDPATIAELAEQPAEEPPADSSVIDDDLMKEFAAAVEGQKALDKAAEKAGDGSVKATSNPDDTDKLMDQFEDFVGNKKS